jgi:4-hydroxymandelate oxidase
VDDSNGAAPKSPLAPRRTVGSWEDAARERLPSDIYDYIAGGSGREQTTRESTGDWAALRFVPRVLRDVSSVSTSTELLGVGMPHPVAVAPTGYHQLVHPDGEAVTAAGAADAGALYVASTRSSLPLEQIAAATSNWWFQVYVLRDRSITEDLVRKAAGLGTKALVLTVDMPYLAVRPRDVGNRFILPATVSSAARSGGNWATGDAQAQDPSITFDDIEWLAQVSGLPVVVKGILHPEDACSAVQAGAAAVWVSAHGGRQLDGVITPAMALGPVSEALSGDAPVLVDGGIRSGTDVLRALALGATAAFLGRPVLWAAATDGRAGVHQLFETLVDELRLGLALCGTTDVRDAGNIVLHHASWRPSNAGSELGYRGDRPAQAMQQPAE